MPLNYGEQEWVSVPYRGKLYVYKTNIPAAVYNDLGITRFNPSQANPNAFYRANSPKPPSFRKKTATGWNSSFVDSSKIPTLLRQGWVKAKNEKVNKRIHLATNSRSLIVTVYVQINNIKYAWNMNKSLYNKLGASVRETLGIEDATPDDIYELVFGATVPKPAKVITQVTSGDSIDTLSTFVAKTKEDNLPVDWMIVEPRVEFGSAFMGLSNVSGAGGGATGGGG